MHVHILRTFTSIVGVGTLEKTSEYSISVSVKD